MLILSKIKSIYLISSITSILIIVTSFLSYEIHQLSVIKELYFKSINEDIKKTINENIEKIENGKVSKGFFRHYQDKTLIREINDFSKAKILIEPIFETITDDPFNHIYKTKSDEFWLIIKNKKKNDLNVGIINISEIIENHELNKINSYKLYVPKNNHHDNNKNILIKGNKYDFVKIITFDRKSLVLYDSTSLSLFTHDKHILLVFLVTLAVLFLFFYFMFQIIKFYIIYPFNQFSSAIFNLKYNNIIPKNPIANENYKELSKAIDYIKEKIHDVKSKELSDHYNINSFINKEDIKNIAGSSITFFSIKIKNKIDMPQSSNLFLNDLKLSLNNESLLIDKVFLSEKLIVLSFYLTLSERNSDIIKNNIVKSLSKNSEYCRLSVNDIFSFKFNPFTMELLKAYEIISECCIANIRQKVLTIKDYYKVMHLKEAISNNNVSHDLVFSPIVSKRKRISYSGVKNIISYEGEEIDINYYYEIVDSEDVDTIILENILNKLYDVNKRLTSLSMNKLEYIIDIDYKTILSPDFYDEIVQIIDRNTIEISKCVFLIDCEYLSIESIGLMSSLSNKGIRLAIRNKSSFIAMNVDSLKFIDSIIFDFQDIDHMSNIEMMSPFYEKYNVNIFAFDFNPSIFNIIENHPTIKMFSSKFIKPDMNDINLIETIENETSVVSFTRKE